MTSKFRVEIADEEEIPQLAAMMVPTFAGAPAEVLMGNTPANIQAAAERHLIATRGHLEETGRPCGIKCLETSSGNEKMVACAYWYIFDKPRSPENARKVNYLISGDWLPEGESREKVHRMLWPLTEKRIKWTVGRGHAILMYMATDKDWRGQGAATACVKWGLERCRELQIIAYLEASEQGAPVYRRLGFEVFEKVEHEVDGEDCSFPVMIWWPPGTKEEDKRPLEA